MQSSLASIADDDVSMRLDAGRQSPFHLLPIVDVDVPIHNDDPLQPASHCPYGIDHLPGMSSVILPVQGDNGDEGGTSAKKCLLDPRHTDFLELLPKSGRVANRAHHRAFI